MISISVSNDLAILKSSYYNTLTENKKLKQKISSLSLESGLKTNSINFDISEPVIEPTPVYLIVPTYPMQNEDTLPETPANNVELNYGNKIVDIYGTNQKILLGRVELNDFFVEPIDNSYLLSVAVFPDCLPGAPRSYRSGYHQGVDFYPYDCGNPCVYGTPIKAIGDGLIVRIDHDFQELDSVSRNSILDKMAKINGDSNRNIDTDEEYQYYFDLLRGRQVIVDHGNGLYSDYCHLSGVVDNLNVGDIVSQGEVIAYLGNSGTSKGSEDYDAGYVIGEEYSQNSGANQMNMIARQWHLHLEIWFSLDGLNNPEAKTRYVEWESYKKLFGYYK